jgi:hypothetical protein
MFRIESSIWRCATQNCADEGIQIFEEWVGEDTLMESWEMLESVFTKEPMKLTECYL